MITRGTYSQNEETYNIDLDYTKKRIELIMSKDGTVTSAYTSHNNEEYSYISNKAKEVWSIISMGLKSSNSKNGAAVPFIYGTSVRHEFFKYKTDYCIETYNGEICLADISLADDGETKTKTSNFRLILNYIHDEYTMTKDIPYIKLTSCKMDFETSDNVDDVVIRSISEIALDKEDITWLKRKKYYIVNNDEQAEKIFDYLDNYNGVIAYDTETTGLKINCFGKINSSYQRELIKWNEEHPTEKIRADKLCGIIFCVENDVSYYFPCFSRKFDSLYKLGSETRKKLVTNIKAKYTVGSLSGRDGDMADYVRNTSEEDFDCGVILMERVRNILETKHILAHNGAFEWRVGWQYEVDTNLKDDTMILHQIMYKFRSTTSNRGESSALKYLAKRELGIEQWELGDFFPDFEEDKGGAVRGKAGKSNKGSKIDFSYMDYDGTRVYAPTDGDVTYQLFMKYKRDMVENHKEQEYIYNVEIVVACAIAYMEFYGHKVDEDKIYKVRDQSKAKLILIESDIRQLVKYSDSEELIKYNQLKEVMSKVEEIDSQGDKKSIAEAYEELAVAVSSLSDTIKDNKEHILNLASPAQVCKLFYGKLEIPFRGDKQSVAKKEIKSLLKAKDEEGNNRYPVVHLYSEYKRIDTLLTKFFDNLPYFMYPGGYIFSSFGQISTATGRMSCKQPNAQQYPKDITGIVVPRKGFVMADADYSQIEYRVLVALAGESKLAELFADPDNDYHTLMASLMYSVPYASVTPKMRGDAKSFNFGIPYGMGFKSLAILLTGMSGPAQVEEAKEKYDLYFKDQPKVRKFFNQVKEMAQVNRYTKTFWNRYRHYSFTDKEGKVNEGKKASALRQAGNAVIQGSAADIFKISVARNFMYIRKNKLLGLLLIINMIHDEQLFEINCDKLNVQRIVRDIGENMQFKVNGFPPLFIGAGVGPTWSKSKGKMTEIHPNLLEQLSREADNMPIRSDKPAKPQDVYDYMSNRVYQFRREQVRDYIIKEENHNKDLHPAIGNLLNLQFNYGHDKYKEGLKDDEFTVLCLSEFMKDNGIQLDVSLFKASKESINDKEEDSEYTDGEEDELELDEFETSDTDFALIDESNELYGSSVQDIIKTFGFVASKSLGVCGIDTRVLNYKQKDNIALFLEEHLCDVGDEGSMQIMFLQESNIVNKTGLWVNGIDGSAIETKLKSVKYNDEQYGSIINERLKDY